MRLAIVSLVVTYRVASAEPAALLRWYPAHPLLNEVVELQPIEHHHINVQAPNACGAGTVIEVAEHGVTCQFRSRAAFEPRIFVCDDAGTVCSIVTPHLSVEGAADARAERRAVSPDHPIAGFIHNDLPAARARARREGKPIVMLYTQLYCPPCNLMKEAALSSPEPGKLLGDVVLLQIDADGDMPSEIEKLQLPGTPTWVLMDAGGDEIARTVLAGSPAAIRRWIDRERPFLDRPIAAVLAARPEALSDGELARVMRWKTAQAEPAEVLHAFAAIKQPDGEAHALADRAATKLASGHALTEAAAKAVESAPGCEQHWPLWRLAASETAAGAPSEEIAARAKLLDRALAIASTRSGPGVDFDCRLDRAYLHHIAAKMFDAAGMTAEAQRAGQAAIAEYASFEPFTPGGRGKAPKVLQAGLLATLHRPQGDALYRELASDEPANFTYDYLQADGLADRKDYDKALAALAKAELKATAHNWLKVERLEVQILFDAGRDEEAAARIRRLLEQVVLPEDRLSPVQRFVGFLRGVEAKIAVRAPRN